MTGRDLDDEEQPAGQGWRQQHRAEGTGRALGERKGKRADALTARQAPQDAGLSEPQETRVSFHFQEKPLESFIQGIDMIRFLFFKDTFGYLWAVGG